MCCAGERTSRSDLPRRGGLAEAPMPCGGLQRRLLTGHWVLRVRWSLTFVGGGVCSGIRTFYSSPPPAFTPGVFRAQVSSGIAQRFSASRSSGGAITSSQPPVPRPQDRVAEECPKSIRRQAWHYVAQVGGGKACYVPRWGPVDLWIQAAQVARERPLRGAWGGEPPRDFYIICVLPP